MHTPDLTLAAAVAVAPVEEVVLAAPRAALQALRAKVIAVAMALVRFTDSAVVVAVLVLPEPLPPMVPVAVVVTGPRGVTA